MTFCPYVYDRINSPHKIWNMELVSPGPMLQIGALSVRWYSLLTVLGILVSTALALRLLKRWNYDFDLTIPGAIVCVLAGLVGARLYYVLLCWQEFAAHPDQIFSL